MTPFWVCLATVLCLTPVSVLSQGNAGECQSKCAPYYQSGYQCALQKQCIPPHADEEKAQCYVDCMTPSERCPSVCAEHYNRITALCQEKCSGINLFCERNCFSEEMENILPMHPEPEVGIFQGVPLLGRQRRGTQVDPTKHVSPRDDSIWSSDSLNSEDVGDLFDIWKKKRDAKRSPGGESSMDMDDFFPDWTNKRDSERSLGSTNSEDVSDIFGIRRRNQDWSWEEGSSEDGVYGDWQDKRQAETEIQQQKR